MLFVIKKNDIIIFQTTHEECVPDDETLKNMIKAGMKAYKDGKVYSISRKKVENK